MKQQTFSDIEYSNRRSKSRREDFLNTMNALIPWDECTALIRPYYYHGRRGRRPKSLEMMLRMYLIQTWFRLSAEGTEEAVSDSYSMRSFLGVDFLDEQVPDATTLLRFRRLLEKYHLTDVLEEKLSAAMKKAGLKIHKGSITDASVSQV